MKLKNIMKREYIQFEKLLLPKNSGLLEITPDPFRSLGIAKSSADAYADDKLGIAVEKYRGEDIPRLCEACTDVGIPAAGLTGDDLLDEYRLRNPDSRLRILDTIDWINAGWKNERSGDLRSMYSRPTLCLIAAEELSIDQLPRNPKVVINGKYESTARQYLDELKDDYGISPAFVQVYGGGIENMIPEMADLGIEIVVSGKTLKYKDCKEPVPKVKRSPELYVVEEVRQSDISVITSWPSGGVSGNSLDDVLARQYYLIEDRKGNPTKSLTSRLLSDRNLLIKKFGEEAAELISGYSKGDRDNVIEESQQVIWVVQTMLASEGIAWQQFLGYVQSQQ